MSLCPRCVANEKEIARLQTELAIERCNATCSIPKRVARWLLLEHAKAPGKRIHVRHDQIAEVLRVRRASVTEVIEQLREAGALVTPDAGRRFRGFIVVENEQALEAQACGCFPVGQS